MDYFFFFFLAYAIFALPLFILICGLVYFLRKIQIDHMSRIISFTIICTLLLTPTLTQMATIAAGLAPSGWWFIFAPFEPKGIAATIDQFTRFPRFHVVSAILTTLVAYFIGQKLFPNKSLKSGTPGTGAP